MKEVKKPKPKTTQHNRFRRNSMKAQHLQMMNKSRLLEVVLMFRQQVAKYKKVPKQLPLKVFQQQVKVPMKVPKVIHHHQFLQ